MGKSLFNKLGNILRVFKGGKKKEVEKLDDDVIIISSSESELKGSEVSSQQVEFLNNLQTRLSKSIDNLSAITDPLNNEFNKLKRTQGTCDILEATKDEEIKIIQSLDRFSHVKNTNSLVLYNAKLYNSTIWSQALGRVLEKEKTETTSISTIHTEVTSSRRGTESIVSYKTLQTISDRRKILGDSIDKTTDNDSTEVIYTQSEKSGTSSEETQKSTSTGEDRLSEVTLKPAEIYEYVEPEVYPVTQTEQEVMTKVSTVVASTSYSSGMIVTGKSMEVDVASFNNKNCFDVLNDKKSEVNIEDTGSREQMKNNENILITVEDTTTKTLPSSATEYEVVNLTQVDLFKEFKTTIAKMRNVLNVLEDKKSLKRISERRTNDQKTNECVTAHLERKNNGHISTQTAVMTYNQISTSTESAAGPASNLPKNEGVMVQFTSDTPSKCKANSKTITLDSSLFNYVKPVEKIRRRKRCRKRRNRYDRRRPAEVPIPSKISKRIEKSQYNKCIVYHITQHKNAVDRSVGTPLYPSKKDSLVLRNTFSALHFGPISDFPAILNKHENEVNKRNQLKYKVHSNFQKNQTPTQPSSNYHQNHENFNRETCINSTTTTTTANWMVFEPPTPLMLQDKQSTSDEVILDRNKSSTQEMISRLLDEEFKTSGLKGKVSSNTINLIKDQFCDKLSGVKTKDIPDIMVTVCVPLKEIVSKIKTSKKPSHEDKAVEYDRKECLTVKTQSSPCDMAVQVTLSNKETNENLQTIPEKISRKPYEIYQQNKLLRQSNSHNKLSSFKKIFQHKNSLSNIDTIGQNPTKPSRIFFSDHSTSSPQFSARRSSEKINAIPKRSPNDERKYKNESKRLKEGFFLNLPPNRFKKKRAQISKLFDGSDSSDRKFSADPKLLYHVHDSSFYSSSKTDEKFNNVKSAKKFLQQTNTSCFPLQQVASQSDIKVKPKFISFSDFLARDEVEEERTRNIGQTKAERRKKLRKFRNADVNTASIAKVCCQDSSTQYDDTILPPQPEPVKITREEAHDKNDIVEVSVYQKLRFEDDVKPETSAVKVKDQKKKKRKNKSNPSESDGSILSLFEDTLKIPKRVVVDVGIQKSLPEILEKNPVKQVSTAICTVPEIQQTPDQTRSLDNTEPIKSKSELKVPEEKPEDITSKDLVVADEPPLETEHNFKDLMKNITNVCNSNFIKSRDCIVELTIYNLIKEIILDHCSHLTEHSKKKVETILAKFVQDFKSKPGNQDIKIVESAIENLVKEIESKSLLKKESERDREEIVHEHKSRSRSMHKHKSKHHTHHKDPDDQDHEKYHRESRRKSKKRHHKHSCGNDDKCDLWKEETEKEFRTVDGRKEYLELTRRLKELECVTKQLSSVARNQRPHNPYYMDQHPRSTNQQIYTVLTESSPQITMSKKKMKFSLNRIHDTSSPPNLSYVQGELNQPVVPIPRNVPKLPVTRIVINLSNLKMLTKNCTSIPSSIEDPLILTDSTEEKRKIMDKFISFEMGNNNRQLLSHHSVDESMERLSVQSEVVHKKKELFTITVQGNKKRKNDESNDRKDFMRIKMCRKNKTISSSSEHATSDTFSTKVYRGKTLGMEDIHRITKEYVKRELNLKNDVLSSDIARDILENKCDVDQMFSGKEDIEAARQRMANYCLFRSLLKKSP